MKPIIVLASICFFVVASADTLNEPFDRVYYMKQVKNSNYVLTIDCPDTGKHTIPINKKKFDNSYYSQHAMALLEGMGPCVCNSPVLILRMVTGRVLTKCLKETCTKDTQLLLTTFSLLRMPGIKHTMHTPIYLHINEALYSTELGLIIPACRVGHICCLVV